jgi:serine/threonine-protein kinase
MPRKWIGNKYELLEPVGEGGMAKVWRGVTHGAAGFTCRVAIKRVLAKLASDAAFVAMFVEEARVVSELQHPNIVQVHDFDQDDEGRYFIVMEWVDGVDLEEWVKSFDGRPTPWPLVVAIGVEILRGLAAAHERIDGAGRPAPIIHRDVSPSNIMLSFDGSVKLVDFGIAKAFGVTPLVRTQRGALKGKFGYMSPEQTQHQDIDLRSDLFSAGIVLHETLSGRRLFKGQNEPQTLQHVIALPIDPPSRLNPQVPAELDRICLRALNRDRERRYSSGEELALELDELVHSLRWGPERLASIMRALFPAGNASGAFLIIEPPTAATQVAPVDDPRRR